MKYISICLSIYSCSLTAAAAAPSLWPNIIGGGGAPSGRPVAHVPVCMHVCIHTYLSISISIYLYIHIYSLTAPSLWPYVERRGGPPARIQTHIYIQREIHMYLYLSIYIHNVYKIYSYRRPAEPAAVR